MNNGQVFITGFNNFDIVYVCGSQEVVSCFQGENNVPMNTVRDEAEAKKD